VNKLFQWERKGDEWECVLEWDFMCCVVFCIWWWCYWDSEKGKDEVSLGRCMLWGWSYQECSRELNGVMLESDFSFYLGRIPNPSTSSIAGSLAGCWCWREEATILTHFSGPNRHRDESSRASLPHKSSLISNAPLPIENLLVE